MSGSVITFTCWEKDKPLKVQLEPEAICFKILPGNELSFKGSPLGDKAFEWALRIEHKDQGIQLFPKGWPYEIEILENGVLLDDWYKYM